jgi:hypothetical protein
MGTSITMAIGVTFFALLLYLNVLATFLTIVDVYWPATTRLAHVFLIWLVPFAGALIKLYWVSMHSPELIERLWIPWPFRSAVEERRFGGDPKNAVESEPGVDAINDGDV